MKITTITLMMVFAVSGSLAIAQGVVANGTARGGPSVRTFSPNRMTPGATTPGSTTGMGRGAAGGMYEDNDPNVYRDGQAP